MRNKIAVEKTSYMGFPRYYGETFSLKIYKWNQKKPKYSFYYNLKLPKLLLCNISLLKDFNWKWRQTRY